MPAFSSVVLEVFASEDGMKLLRFLERRLAEQVPRAALHKWIRTGRVRVNKGRAKPFSLLVAGDLVRVPPFARIRAVDIRTEAAAPVPESVPERGGARDFSGPEEKRVEVSMPPVFTPATGLSGFPALSFGADVRVIAGNEYLLALAKPAGLACQPGSGHEDSLCARLAVAFSGAPFIPAPAHRLDRHTSGLVLAGMTNAAQQRLHSLFASGAIHKEYLAWVRGDWGQSGPCLLEDRLVKKIVEPGMEGMVALPGGKTVPFSCSAPNRTGVAPFPPGKTGAYDSGFAASAALAVCTIPEGALPRSLRNGKGAGSPNRPFSVARANPESGGPRGATLLLLRLFTGRTHQLRVQLASRGFPIIGDGRYGGPHFSSMLLHAFALSLPERTLAAHDGEPTPPGGNGDAAPGRLEFTMPPSWPEPFMPETTLLSDARQSLASALENAADAGS